MKKNIRTAKTQNIKPAQGFAPDQKKMYRDYNKCAQVRQCIVDDLKEQIEHILVSLHSAPIVKARIKSFASYYKKYLKLGGEGKNLPVKDLLGIRIICPFIEDIDASEILIRKRFEVVEKEEKGRDYNFKEFGYESTHLLIKIPNEIAAKYGDPETDIAEIQIRTILQDAWAEVEHELVYKAKFVAFDDPIKRKLAAVNASIVLGDIIFQEIRSHQRKYSEEVKKRRKSFYKKIEDHTDELLFPEEQEPDKKAKPPVFDTGTDTVIMDNVSIDDLMVNALTAHNQNRFSEAINYYSRIVKLNPRNTELAEIYKHRGMAYFACSQYDEAIDDFNKALELDEKSYRIAYYRGVVHSVIKEYALAIDDYTKSLAINPYQSFCLFRRGQAFYHIGDYPQALSDCETSLSLEPQNETVKKFKKLLLDKLKM